MTRVVSRDEWLVARRDLLDREKELAAERAKVTEARRALPMVRIDKDYVFESADGKARLLDLFEGRRQLIVYHYMFEPSWDDGCSSCTPFVQDLGHLPHLHAADTTLVLVSRAPQAKLGAYRERMGWTVPWYSSHDSDFNYDFHVTLDESRAPIQVDFLTKEEHERTVGPWDMFGSELPGVSVFLRDGESVYHTYSTAMSLGDSLGLMSSATFLELTPLGVEGDPEA